MALHKDIPKSNAMVSLRRSRNTFLYSIPPALCDTASVSLSQWEIFNALIPLTGFGNARHACLPRTRFARGGIKDTMVYCLTD